MCARFVPAGDGEAAPHTLPRPTEAEEDRKPGLSMVDCTSIYALTPELWGSVSPDEPPLSLGTGAQRLGLPAK